MATCDPELTLPAVFWFGGQTITYFDPSQDPSELARWEQIMSEQFGLVPTFDGASGVNTHSFTHVGTQEADTDVNPTGELIDGNGAHVVPAIFKFQEVQLSLNETAQELADWEDHMKQIIGLDVGVHSASSTASICDWGEDDCSADDKAPDV